MAELNPDEQVWSQLKNRNLGKMIIRNLDGLVKKEQAKLRSIQRTSAVIKSMPFLLGWIADTLTKSGDSVPLKSIEHLLRMHNGAHPVHI